MLWNYSPFFFSCRPLVCQNGATCTNSVGGFSCICVNGWTGPECSVNIDDCAGAACFNGATCIDRVGAFYCKCTPGKTGKFQLTVIILWSRSSPVNWAESSYFVTMKWLIIFEFGVSWKPDVTSYFQNSPRIINVVWGMLDCVLFHRLDYRIMNLIL